MKSRVFGIDLGTTNSAIAVYMGNDVSEVIRLENGDTILPSCIMALDDGSFVVGDEAYNKRYLPSVASSVKEYMGTDKVIRLVTEGGKIVAMRPEEVGAEVIKALVDKVRYLYTDVMDVCITVPAAFTSSAREATRRAGELAGLNVVAIINEPTSAALCYRTKESETVLIYDLGGGTFDTSVLKIDTIGSKKKQSIDTNFAGFGINLGSDEVDGESDKTTCTVLCSRGDVKTGGNNIDHEILKYMELVFKSKSKTRTKGNDFEHYFTKEFIDKILLEIEMVKKQMHDKEKSEFSYDISVDSRHIKNVSEFKRDYPKGITIGFTHKDLVRATETVYKRTKLYMTRAMNSKSVDKNKIKKIILVGGSTESKIIRDLLTRDFPEMELNHSFRAFEIVAKGAAIQSAATKGISSMSITDVAPYTIGIGILVEDVSGNSTVRKVKSIIKKDTKLPIIQRKTFDVENRSNRLRIKIYQGDAILAEDCELLGQLALDRNDKSETVDLEVKINSQGILEFKASSNGVEKSVKLTNVFGTKVEEKTQTKFKKFARRWEDTLVHEGHVIDEDLREALDNYASTGNTDAKALIQSRLATLEEKVEMSVEKTSFFGE